jgi:hypothetical protein
VALGPQGAAGVAAHKWVPSQPRGAPQQPAGVHAPSRQDHAGPGSREGPAPRDPAERQDGKARAQRRRSKGQGQWGALPLVHNPGQQRHKARRDDQRLPSGPALGRRRRAARAPLLTHRICFTMQPRGQKRTDGGQRTGARQPHPQAPQGHDCGLRLGQRGQAGVDSCGPCSHTGVARHTFPPRM